MHSLTGAHAQALEKCMRIDRNYIVYAVWLRSRSVHTADGARLCGVRTMHTPSSAFRHLCRKPVLGVCEPCSHRDEQVGQALFVQGTQHCALLTPISGLCSVWVSVTHSPSPSTKATQRGGGGGGRRVGGGGGGGTLVAPVSQRGSYDSIIWCP